VWESCSSSTYVRVLVAGWAKTAASAKRRLLARLQLHLFLVPIALGIWAASKHVVEDRPPAPSDDAEETDGLHQR
jgi:hypothetical protein